MKKVRINETSLKKIMNIVKEDYDEYEDDTMYSKWEYSNVIMSYLENIANKIGDGCYAEEDNGNFYLDFIDFQIIFDLDSDTGILYVMNIKLYNRSDAQQAFSEDEKLIKVLLHIKNNPLNVSQTLQ
jgi:hypothetical protein